MARLIKKMPDPQNVVAGQRATVRLPVGNTYNMLFIRAKTAGADMTEAQMKSMLGDVRLLIDGDLKIEASATELLDLAKYYGVTIQNGVLPVIFSRPWQRSIVGEDVLSYGTADVSTMDLTVDIDSGATTPTLELYAIQSQGTPLGQHCVIKRHSRTVSATGEVEEANLPRGDFGLMALHLTTDAVSTVEVRANERKAHESDLATRKFRDSLTNKTHQTGYTHINFCETDRVSDVLPLALEDFRVITNHTATGSFNYIQERIDSKA